MNWVELPQAATPDRCDNDFAGGVQAWVAAACGKVCKQEVKHVLRSEQCERGQSVPSA